MRILPAMSLVLSFVITAHGYGHASRQMEVVRTLLDRRPGARAVVLSGAPEAIFRDYLSAVPGVLARVTIVPFRADVGIVQRDGLTMDHEATLRALADAWSDPDGAEDALASALAPYRPAIVVGDVPPVAFAAAARLGIPSVAVGNFDWAWIYRSYAEREPAFAPWERVCTRWQAQATVAVHLDPGPPLTGFPRVVDGGLLARRSFADPQRIRAALGVPEGNRAVLVSFGGSGLRDAGRRIPAIPGVTWILADPMDDLGRSDTRFARALPYVALLAACDAVFSKPGYGIVSEAAWQRTRLLYTDRGDFPEYPWLVRWMHEHMPAAYVPSIELGTERGAEAIRRALEELFAQPERWPEGAEGAARVAEVVEELIGVEPQKA
jgi:hypothetical protein